MTNEEILGNLLEIREKMASQDVVSLAFFRDLSREIESIRFAMGLVPVPPKKNVIIWNEKSPDLLEFE